jgi:CRP/FNR family transcriptional regulator, cyclic AMP receptor protein
VFDASRHLKTRFAGETTISGERRDTIDLPNDLQQEGVMTDRKAVEPCKSSDPPASQKVGVKQHSMRRTTDDLSAGEGLRLFLKHNTFFGSLSDTALDALLHRGHIKQYAAGDVICRRQERGDTLMVIVTGRIKVMSNSVDGKEIVLNFLGPGDTTGEIAVLDGKQRTADVIALEKSEVFLVHSRDLLPLLIAHPQALLEVVQVLCEKLRAASAIIEDSSLDVRRRTARGLLRLALQHGRTSKEGVRVELKVSQSELGGYLGLSRENVNRQLSQLKHANVLRNAGTHILVTDEAALCEIAETTWMEQ